MDSFIYGDSLGKKGQEDFQKPLYRMDAALVHFLQIFRSTLGFFIFYITCERENPQINSWDDSE